MTGRIAIFRRGPRQRAVARPGGFPYAARGLGWPGLRAAASGPAVDRPIRAAGRALATILATILATTACGANDHGHSGQAGATHGAASPHGTAATPLPSPRPLSALLLRLSDLPAGYIPRPLDDRNLPSGLTGCRALEELMANGIGTHEQVEFFRFPLGPWIDEAVTKPATGTAAKLSGTLARALAGCASVTVTEEGQRVRLTLSPATAAGAGPRAHAYHATGNLHGMALSMDIVLVPAGSVILLLTNTSVAGPADKALTARAARTALRRALSA